MVNLLVRFILRDLSFSYFFDQVFYQAFFLSFIRRQLSPLVELSSLVWLFSRFQLVGTPVGDSMTAQVVDAVTTIIKGGRCVLLK